MTKPKQPSLLQLGTVQRPKLSDLYGILAPRRRMPPFDREKERTAAAEAAGRYDAEKTARIMKRLKK